MSTEEIVIRALEAKEKAYAPYSGFRVGACVETENGELITGSNIEIASYSPTLCAERTAIFTAVHRGARKIRRIAVTADGKDVFPCGVCRQVMREFGADDMEILIVNAEDDVLKYTLNELLPYSFGPEDLKNV